MRNATIYLAVILSVVLISIASAQSTTSSVCNSGSVIQNSAPWYCSQINVQAQTVWAQWAPLAIIVATLAFMLAVLIFMAGIATKNQRIRDFGVGEMYEAIASMLIAAGFLFITAVLFGLIPSIVTGPINPYNTSLSYISTTINTTSSLASRLFIISALDRYYASITPQVCFLNSLITVCSPTAFRPFGVTILLFYWPAWALTQFLLDALISLYTQYYFILFFLYAGIPVFLIPGIILRAFLPTRGVGGMMIAIAIGFFLVMPTLFSVAYYFTNVGAIKALSNTYSTITQYGAGAGAQANAISPYSPLVLAVSNANSVMNGFWLSILFFPALILAITYTAVTNIANLIGGAAAWSNKRLTSLI